MDRTPQWASVGVFPSGLAADVARQALEDAEIPVLVKGGQPGIFGPAFQGAITGGIEVLVPDVALEHAREILGADAA